VVDHFGNNLYVAPGLAGGAFGLNDAKKSHSRTLTSAAKLNCTDIPKKNEYT
jgi:hypothetical protein